MDHRDVMLRKSIVSNTCRVNVMSWQVSKWPNSIIRTSLRELTSLAAKFCRKKIVLLSRQFVAALQGLRAAASQQTPKRQKKLLIPTPLNQASRSSGELDGPWRPLVINIFSQNRDKYYLQILSHVCSCLKTPRQHKPLAGS